MGADDLARGRELLARVRGSSDPWYEWELLEMWLCHHAADLLDAAERAARLGELLLRCRPYLAGYRCESEQEGDDLAVLERDIHAALAQPMGARDE